MAILIGMGLAKTQIWTPSFGAAIGVSVLCLVLSYRRRLWLALPAMICCGLVIGLWRGAAMQAALTAYQPLLGQKSTLQAVVSEGSTYTDKGALDFRADHINLNGQHLPGTLRVTTFSPVEPRRGQTVEVTGKLYDGFGPYQAAVYYATVKVTRADTSWVETMRRNFTAAILNVLPEPQASLGLGFLIGLKSQLPASLYDQLQIVGLMHIVVASGYNLTVLVRLAKRLFAKRSKYQAMVATALLMSGFLLITGFSASMTRAALVASLSLAAWCYGRRIHPLVLLLFTAAVTALVNPLYLWSDLGWWLSFLSFGGVMLGAPLLQRRFYGERAVPALAQVLFETVCAQLTTLPLILWTFGTLSVLALPANLIVVPLIPLAMLLTFIAGVANWLLPGVGSWLALPAIWLLTFMTSVIGWIASVPWAMTNLPIALTGMLILYGSIVLIAWLLLRKLRFRYLLTSVID